jgi:hypothetical protein
MTPDSYQKIEDKATAAVEEALDAFDALKKSYAKGNKTQVDYRHAALFRILDRLPEDMVRRSFAMHENIKGWPETRDSDLERASVS